MGDAIGVTDEGRGEWDAIAVAGRFVDSGWGVAPATVPAGPDRRGDADARPDPDGEAAGDAAGYAEPLTTGAMVAAEPVPADGPSSVRM